MVDIRTESLEKPVDVAEYLFRRLHQIGVRSVHGLPGDYNLTSLDYIPKCDLNWVGNVNELNAAYAADGYARVKGISALMTTFGVGELSAINGHAGAYSEHVPVVHIVGCPSTVAQRDGMLLHHTLGNGNFSVFADMAASISCAVAKLKDPAEIAAQIDHALRECWIRSRPVYILFPTDMVQRKVEGARLDTPIDLSEPANDTDREDYVVKLVLEHLVAAKNPVILVDACAVRHRVLDEVKQLVDKTNLPVFVTPMGKGAIDESHPNFGGTYAGVASHPVEVQGRIEQSDLILAVGAMKSDFNTAGFSYRTSQLTTIDFHSDHCIVGYSEFPRVSMRGVLHKVAQRANRHEINAEPSIDVDAAAASDRKEAPESKYSPETITQAWLWPRVSDYLRENDVLVSETGTANFGLWETKFPRGTLSLNQTLWGSIGWSVGACQGAALAVKDAGADRRTILFVGDGSFQLSAQEVSTMLRRGLTPTIFVICNDGYTIERLIHGMEAEYNDITNWNYKDLVAVFGGADKASTFQVRTKDELDKLLKDDEFNAAKKLQFVELYMEKEDAPAALVKVAQQTAKLNAKME